MRSYELTVIVRPKESEALIAKVKDILQKHNVTIEKDESWGNKKLAYEISNETEGYYMFLHVQTTPETVKKIISDFRLDSNILRYLFVQQKKSA